MASCSNPDQPPSRVVTEDESGLSDHKEERLIEWIDNQQACGLYLPPSAKFKAYIAGKNLVLSTGNSRENADRVQTLRNKIGEELSYYGYMTPEGELENLFKGNIKVVDEKYLFFDLNSDQRRYFLQPNQLTSLAVNLAPKLIAHIRHGIGGMPKDGIIVVDWKHINEESLLPGNIPGSDVLVDHLLRFARRITKWDRNDFEAVITGEEFLQPFMEATLDDRNSPRRAFSDIEADKPNEMLEGGLFFRHPNFYNLDELYKNQYGYTFDGQAFLRSESPQPANQIVTRGTVGKIVRYGLLPLGEPIELTPDLFVRQPVVCALIEPRRENLTSLTALYDMNTVILPNNYFWTDIRNVGVAENPFDIY